jgi:hypothetical protein
MPVYHFTLYADATNSADLGYMPMADDADALAFARRIIRELMQRHSREYADSSMHITEGERPVGHIWKAQVRLCARYRRLTAAGEPPVVATTAIAREMIGFIWAIAHRVELQSVS